MSEDTLWLGIHYVHLIAMAFFVGGQLVVAAVVMPVERRNSDRVRLRAVGRRFGIGSLAALALLASTGAAMAAHWGYWQSGTLQLKLLVVAIVVALTTLHLFWPRVHVLSALIFLGSLLIVWLGLNLAH